MIALLPVVALTVIAPPAGPFDDLPRLLGRSAAAVQSGWEAVKESKDPAEQRKSMARKKLDRAVCHDTLDIREVMARTDLPLRLRDTVRWRTVARPEMIALITGAMVRLQKSDPDASITVGDLAQQGCGQIRYGTVVELVDKATAAALAEKMSRYFGGTGRYFAMPPEAFIDEYPRFVDREGPIWVEQRLTGVARSGLVRLETRRFDEGRVLSGESVRKLIERTRRRIADRRNAVVDRVNHELAGASVRLRRVRWTSARDGRWMEAIYRPSRSGATRETLVRVREARFDPKKPTSRKYEERYRFGDDGEARLLVHKHLLEYEAHHTSHLGGLDADLSYVTWNNEHHFSPDVAILDPERSWRWLDALRRTARDLGIPLTALFVDRSILRRLKEARVAPRKHPLWRKLKRSPGHDSHVHVRIGATPRFAGRSIDTLLSKLGLD